MGIKQLAVSGVKWNTIATIVTTLIQFSRLAVLTRLLERSDFGIIAIAWLVIGFVEIFSGFGLTTALIHKQDTTDKQYSSVFWMNLTASAILFSILCAITPLASEFYGQPLLDKIIPILGTQILISAFGKMFQTIKSKNLEFKFISLVTIICNLVGFISTIILAFLSFGVFSLVYGSLIQTVLTQTIYSIAGLKEQRILFYVNLKEIKGYIKIGGFQLGSQVLDFISNKIDILLIGRFFGMDNLGVYNLSKELIVRPYQMINSVVTSAASPAFAKIQNSPDLMSKSFAELLSILTALCFPVYIALFVFARPVIDILYGAKFAEAAIYMQILTILGISSFINSPVGILMIAQGRTDLGFKWTIIRVVITTTVILAVSGLSINAVLYAQAVIGILFFFVFWKLIVFTLSGIKLKEYFGIFGNSALYALLTGIPFIIALNAWEVSLTASMGLMFAYFALYIFFHAIFNREFLRQTFTLIINR